jgi:hypothetical protein
MVFLTNLVDALLFNRIGQGAQSRLNDTLSKSNFPV